MKKHNLSIIKRQVYHLEERDTLVRLMTADKKNRCVLEMDLVSEEMLKIC
jgi:hypothetical protein